MLDKTHTAMGGRMLRSWLEKPLLDAAEITRRHAAVEELVDSVIIRGVRAASSRSAGPRTSTTSPRNRQAWNWLFPWEVPSVFGPVLES